jgi:hypothetical protein
VDFDAEFFSGFVFAVTVVTRFHKLDHAAIQTAAGCTHHQAEGAGGFTLAVARVDHEESTRVLLVIFATPLVFFFFHRRRLDHGLFQRVFSNVVEMVGALDSFLQQTNDHRFRFFPAAAQSAAGSVAMTAAAK